MRATREEEIARQEQELDDILDSVRQVGNVSLKIQLALQEHKAVLDGMGRDMDTTHASLEQVTSRTARMVRSAGGPRPFAVIACLGTIALVLLMLVVYT